MCQYCELNAPLDSLAEKWVFDYPLNFGEMEVAFGGIICPERKQLDISVVTSPVIDREILNKQIDINYCPFCGRKIIGGEAEEPMMLEKYLSMYDGSCAISVIRENGEQLCAVQELGEIKHDLWYEECKSSVVTAFKIVPDDYGDNNVVLLITVK